MEPNEERALPVRHAAEVLGVSPARVRQMLTRASICLRSTQSGAGRPRLAWRRVSMLFRRRDPSLRSRALRLPIFGARSSHCGMTWMLSTSMFEVTNADALEAENSRLRGRLMDVTGAFHAVNTAAAFSRTATAHEASAQRLERQALEEYAQP